MAGHPSAVWRTSLLFGALALAHAPAAAQRPDSTTAVLLGRITDTAGVGLSGAEVAVLKLGRRALTNDTGGFRLDGLAPGTSIFTVRRLGYLPISFTATLRGGHIAHTTLSLSAAPQLLPETDVSDTAASHWLDSFNRRREGHDGTFFTREDIVKAGARRGTDMARRVPGVRLQKTFTGDQLVMERGGQGGSRRTCTPTYFVHNVQYSGTLDDFPAEDIEALEFYIGISEIPPELQRAGKNVCAAVVIWTRDPRARPGTEP